MADKQFIKGAITGVLCASLAPGGGYVGLQKAGRAGSTVLSDVAVPQKIKYLEDIIDQNYLDEVNEDSLKEGLYTGLLYGIGDPYSRYYTEEEYEEEMRDTEGSYSGIGVSITQNSEGGILVVDCYEGGPADLAGIKVNDVITAVDGTDVTEMTPSEVSEMIRNKEDGTSVLTVYHQEADEPEEITVTISNVELPTVSYEMLEDSIGYLRITEFTLVTPQQFEDAYQDFQAKGMEKLIVDLRDNPGGVLSSVCDVLRQILPEGLIVFFVFVCTNIAAALVDCDLHIQLTACAAGKCCDMMFGIQNLNITVTLDIGTLYFTFAFHVNVSNLRLIAFACIFDRKTFQIQNDFCNVFFYAGNHAKFMKYTINFHIAYCSTGQRGQQDSSQGVAQSCTIASFQGFYNKLTVCAIGCHFSNFNARFFKFKHSFKPPFFMIECRRAYSPTALPLTSLHNR